MTTQARSATPIEKMKVDIRSLDRGILSLWARTGFEAQNTQSGREIQDEKKEIMFVYNVYTKSGIAVIEFVIGFEAFADMDRKEKKIEDWFYAAMVKIGKMVYSKVRGGPTKIQDSEFMRV